MPKSRIRKSGQQDKQSKADRVRINEAYLIKTEEYNGKTYGELLELQKDKSIRGTYRRALDNMVKAKEPQPEKQAA